MSNRDVDGISKTYTKSFGKIFFSAGKWEISNVFFLKYEITKLFTQKLSQLGLIFRERSLGHL